MIGVGAHVMRNQITPAKILTSLSIQTAPILLLCTGIWSLLVAVLGFVFICEKSPIENGERKRLKITFIILGVAALLPAFIGGGIGLSNIKKVTNTFEPDLKTKLELYGRSGGSMEDVNDLQKEYKCCGVNTFADWRITVWGGRRYDKVPDACCKDETFGCGYCFVDADKTLNKKGCASIVVEEVKKSLLTVGVIGIIIGIVEVILWVVFLCSCCCNANGDEYLPKPSTPLKSQPEQITPRDTPSSKERVGSGQSKVVPASEEDCTPSRQEVCTSSPGASHYEHKSDKPSSEGGAASSREESEKPSKEKTTSC